MLPQTDILLNVIHIVIIESLLGDKFKHASVSQLVNIRTERQARPPTWPGGTITAKDRPVPGCTWL
jgi:hypothetical protein